VDQGLVDNNINNNTNSNSNKKPKKFKIKKNQSLSTLMTKNNFSKIKLQKKKENIVYLNGGRVIATMSI
jgi:hypothetical protein